jgi:hypothetical protein
MHGSNDIYKYDTARCFNGTAERFGGGVRGVKLPHIE